MTPVVRAKCPYCQSILRIPSQWLDQPLKCKRCQKVFRPKMRHKRAPQLANESGEKPAAAKPPIRPWLVAAVCFILVTVVLGGALWVAAPQLSGFFHPIEAGLAQNAKRLEKAVADSLPKAKVGDEPAKQKEPPVKKKNGLGQKTVVKVAGTPFPRRALLIGVSNYLLFNPLAFGNARQDGGKNPYPGSSIAALADSLSRPPLNLPANQIIQLSDAGKNPFPTSKPVIEQALTDFIDGARAQDRLIVLFTGHALEIDKNAYLVPIEGDRENAKTLIPLAWVYEKLASSRAREKLLILDVFRYPPGRGEELPGSGEMTEAFDAKLLVPPVGVQVWSSCIKGQLAIELERGSAFLQALCKTLQKGLPGITAPADPLPLDRLVPKVNEELLHILPAKMVQTARLSGTRSEDDGASYDPSEPLAPKLVLKAIAAGGAQAASLPAVKSIVEELNRLPPVRAHQKPVPAVSFPAFSAKTIDEYKPDYSSWAELVQLAKDKEKYPLRAGVLETMAALNASEKIVMKEKLTSGGDINAIKKQFFASQKEPGVIIFQLESALGQMKAAGENRPKETSKRWLAHYDYALARLQARLVYLYEYNNILAQVRSDSLPPLDPALHDGWVVGSQKKVQISEPKVKEMVKNIGRTWKKLADENPGTPWAILAARENMTALGLVWRPLLKN